ncbi:ferritin [Paraliobacillus salinarum]|uniref:ferritin n=1 Tax=Paraliobacillus salinarum TaxID=1158996 RepID=UPI0015F6CDC7|nr:ferritin [Paraliobacillus salinarum]
MVKDEVQQLLNQLIQIEQISTTLYLAMSAYMDRKNYTGMTKWLKLQSDEERTHMLTLIDYLSGKDGVVKIGEIPAQASNYGTPLETFEKVLEHERYVTDAYRQAYDYIKQIDPQTAVIVQDFLREQIDEEAQALTIVERLKLAGNNSSAILLIDQELGQRQARV